MSRLIGTDDRPQSELAVARGFRAFHTRLLALVLCVLWVSLTGRQLNGQAASKLQTVVTSATLDGIRWPNFRDYQPSLQKFYAPANYAPAWIQGTDPSPQVLAMIELFKNAWR